MTTIYLIRHAEAEGNLYRRIHGWYDSLVTDNGFAQIKALEERFRDIPVNAVYSSDLYRTMATARAVYLPKGLELHTDPDLREINLGDWEDHPWGEVRHFDPESMNAFNRSDPAWRAPNGESLAEAGARLEGALRRIACAHPGQTVAVFSHGTAIRQALANIKGLAPNQWSTMPHSENTAVTCLVWDGEAFSLCFEMDASHIDESISTLGKQAWWRKDPKAAPDMNLWFRPMDWETEHHLYLEARRDAWTGVHGKEPFYADGFLTAARENLSQSPWGLAAAMAGERIVGMVQLDFRRFREDGSGYIPFVYVYPEYQNRNLGVQLIGHAVSVFRPLGRDKLRLRCSPDNLHAQHIYAKHGFIKIGEEQGSRVPLDILEKYIGYER